MPYIGKSPGQGVRNRFLYTATSGQTTFSGSDDDGRTLTYSDSKFTDVFLNGVLLDPNSDYNATTGTSIVLTSGATAGDIVEVISFDTFSVFNGNFTTENLNTESINGGQIGGRRNLIINGAMQVAQRGTSSTSQSIQTVDRFGIQNGGIGAFTQLQSTDAPDGFSNSFKLDCTTADPSPAASDYLYIYTRLEAQDLQQLAYGTSGAKTCMLSFYVKSNKTGSFTFNARQPDNSFRMYSKNVTISSANTWERVSVELPSDASGLINNDNGFGLEIALWLNSGSDYSGGSEQSWGADTATNKYLGTLDLGASTSDEFFITGVQLEVGSVATKFEHRSYGDELALCQRYCVVYTNDVDGAETFVTLGIGFSSGSTAVRWTPYVPVPLRAEASISQTGSLEFFSQGVTLSSPTAVRDGCSLTPAYNFTSSGSLTNGVAGVVRGYSDATAKITLDAEL